MTRLGHPSSMNPRIPLPDPLSSRPFTTRQGVNAGLGRRRLRGPDLDAPFHGIRIPRTAQQNRPRSNALAVEKLCLALQQKLSPDSWFCGITAAVVMGIPLPARLEQSRTLQVAVLAPHRAPAGRGVRGHTFTASTNDVRMWHGLHISSPERVWCELAGTLNLPDLVAAGDYLIQRDLPLTSPDRLADAVARFPGRRGIPTLQSALPLLHDRSESRQESRLRVIVVLAVLAGLEVNYPVTTSGGYNYRGDLAFPEYKMFIEYQSELHRTTEAFRADMTRISRLEADGWYVMQVNIRDLDDPAELVQRIRRLLARRAAPARTR
jgi:very-short-patch-repair endonuclease